MKNWEIYVRRHFGQLASFDLRVQFFGQSKDHLVPAGPKMKHDGNQLQELFSIPHLNSE